MDKRSDFTQGAILPKLLRFALPVLGAMILQVMYGAVDLMVVGRFADAAAVSAVSTGSQLMHTITTVITGLSMGTTVLLGRTLGEGRNERAGGVIGGAIWLFGAMALALSAFTLFLAPQLCTLMRAPKEAFDQTVAYVRICGAGTLFIVAYNLLGSVFRGIGDSQTPLLSVVIACVVNIVGDLLFVCVFHMAADGAALATVLAQALSVAICLAVVRRRGLPFPFHKKDLRPDKRPILGTVRLGAPIALQDLLVSLSFVVLMVIVNSLGLVASAGMGVAQKLCGFIMLVPSAFSQSLSAFVAQNIGAGKARRARQAMLCGMAVSFAIGTVMFYAGFFHGDVMCSLFAADAQVIAAGADYLKSYAIDTLMTAFLFCFIGYFNGCGLTTFVMLQGLIGAFGVRIPVSFLMSRIEPVSLFRIGLATPASTAVQIALCAGFLFWQMKKESKRKIRQ
ncbi:MAG: MATE family efflux transporter [Clostridia bacterium]|nr:MATE family efflux transporter [Clostridia bacterium]